MSLEFYLFDVDEGQCAAAKLPNGSWCMFDAGRSSQFSPVRAVWSLAGCDSTGVIPGIGAPFTFFKATVSHLHGDHLGDWQNLLTPAPRFFRTVDYDGGYLDDVAESSSSESLQSIHAFCRSHASVYNGPRVVPDYGGASINELSLSVPVARALGGSANSRVNNASLVTRIDCFGNSILLCGDVEKEAWEFALTNATLAPTWRPFVSGIDILVAPHHGHASGYSTTLLALSRPKVVLVSVASKDPSVDSRYSGDAVSGILVNNNAYKAITTRSVTGHVVLSISPPILANSQGARSWTL